MNLKELYALARSRVKASGFVVWMRESDVAQTFAIVAVTDYFSIRSTTDKGNITHRLDHQRNNRTRQAAMRAFQEAGYK
jgi:hypothetical protein